MDIVALPLRKKYSLMRELEEKLKSKGLNPVTDESLIRAKRLYRKHLRIHNEVQHEVADWHDSEGRSWRTFSMFWDADDEKPWQQRKQDVLEWAWEELAHRITSDSDCTGQWYTSDIRVAYKCYDVFVIYEEKRLDI